MDVKSKNTIKEILANLSGTSSDDFYPKLF